MVASVDNCLSPIASACSSIIAGAVSCNRTAGTAAIASCRQWRISLQIYHWSGDTGHTSVTPRVTIATTENQTVQQIQISGWSRELFHRFLLVREQGVKIGGRTDEIGERLMSTLLYLPPPTTMHLVPFTPTSLSFSCSLLPSLTTMFPRQPASRLLST
jgi:hypothetical protein